MIDEATTRTEGAAKSGCSQKLPGSAVTERLCRVFTASVRSLTIRLKRIEPGGSYRRENVQPSCRACNSRRGKSPEWVPDEDPVPEF